MSVCHSSVLWLPADMVGASIGQLQKLPTHYDELRFMLFRKKNNMQRLQQKHN